MLSRLSWIIILGTSAVAMAQQPTTQGPGGPGLVGTGSAFKALHAEAQRVWEQRAKEREIAHMRVQELRDRIRERSGRADISPEGLRAAAAKLDDEKQQLELDAAGQEARRKALLEIIAKLSIQAEDRAKADAVVVELEKLRALREEDVNLMKAQFEKGGVPRAEFAAAEAAIAEVRVRLAERRREAAAAAGGDALAQANRELLTMTIASAERSARLELVSGRVRDLSAALAMLPALNEAERALDSAEHVYSEAQDALENLRRAAPAHP